MSTPEQPSFEDALARAREASKELAAVLEEPPPREPVWKRPRKPKSKAEKKRELRKQRRRLHVGRRRLAATESRRPRARQGRIGNAAARRDARALSRVRHSTAWLW